MKNIRIILLAALMAVTLCSRAEDILSKEEITQAASFLPAPPDSGSALFALDRARYEWGKTVRNTPRGRQAVADAQYEMGILAKTFSPAFGMEISMEKTPVLFSLLKKYTRMGSAAARQIKRMYKRRRPFVVFGEQSGLPEVEKDYVDTYSYPSGHANLGWTMALILSEINPERQDTLMRRGYEYGQSRVILGFHYQSDVDASRLLSSAVVARFHADSTFQHKLARAKEEFRYRRAASVSTE